MIDGELETGDGAAVDGGMLKRRGHRVLDGGRCLVQCEVLAQPDGRSPIRWLGSVSGADDQLGTLSSPPTLISLPSVSRASTVAPRVLRMSAPPRAHP